MYEEKIYVGSGLDACAMMKALGNQRRKDVVVSPMKPVARAIMSANKDSRVEVHDVTVDDVQIDPNFRHLVHVEFTALWSLYHGCVDRNESDDEPMSERANYTDDGYLVFQLPTPRRPQNDC
jgi:hypothetical protein